MQKNVTASLENRVDQLKSTVRNLVDAGKERGGEIRSKASDVKDAVVENGGEVLDRANAFIKENPIVAVAAAIGIGYIVIRMLRR